MAIPISNVTRRVVYAASGTGPYAFTFEILANTDIAVYRDDTLLTLTTNYTVTINSNGTGSITLTAAPTGATQIAIVGNRTIQRTTDFVTGGDFFANTVNDEMDQQTIFAQQNAEGLQRALLAPQTDPTTINMTLPAKATRANKTLSFDANGNPSAGVSAADVANAVTYATNAANSATAAASSASSASSSASAASASASTASTQASNASTSATNAASSASSASTSASNAASSASTASTQASNASTSATNAASSASAASTSASNAATSATNASNSATTASTQASNAATSASNASSSATSAANSAAAAASALDSFDDRYLGTKTSDPTLDNDGNALVAGALYFSTTQNVMKVYDGASWITATSAGATSLLRFRYVATSGQTTFSGADSAAATLTYTVNNIAVHRNGVTLDTSEYTASNGTSIVLNVAAGTGDIVDIIAFKSFTVADALSAVSGGTVNGGVNITGNVGIGTASPDLYAGRSTMSINGSTGGIITLQANGTQKLRLFTGASSSVGTLTGALDISTGDASALTFGTNSAERMRIDSSGNVGIGTISPSYELDVVKNTSGTPSISITNTTAGANAGARFVAITDGGNAQVVACSTTYTGVTGAADSMMLNANSMSNGITFALDGVIKSKLDSSGNLLVGATSAAANERLNVTGSIANNIARFINTNASSYGILIYYGTGVDPNGTSNEFIDCRGNGGGTPRFQVRSNGGIANYSANNVNLSDRREKTNFAPAGDYLAKICAIPVQTFNYIDQNLEEDDGLTLGVVAQDVQAVAPEMVMESNWGTEEEPKMRLSIYQTDLQYALMKCIQEQQAIITSLTDRITALENK